MMNSANLRDPASLACRIYVGHLNENTTQDLLDIKFSAHGKISGFLRTSPGFAFIQYDNPSCAAAAIQAENGSFLAGQRILVK
jgi:RNA recognition motif-containing protein